MKPRAIVYWGQNPGTHPKAMGSMHKKLTMVYWKGDKFWIGKFIEYPEIMTKARPSKNLREPPDAYSMMIMEDVPEGLGIKV